MNLKKILKDYKDYKKKRKIMEIKEIDSKVEKVNLCIIIPYRNDKFIERENHLKWFIKKSKIFNENVKILIIEQSNDNKKFNRGKLLNIGIELSKNIDYYILHDVDLFPDKELLEYYYTYPNKPLHIARVWTSKYTGFTYFGGITSVSKKMLIQSNGFPNNFYGWGGEDDALYNRIAKNNNIIYVPNKGKVDEYEHIHQGNLSKKENINKKKLILDDLNNYKYNGLNNLKYKKIKEIIINKNIKKITVTL